MGKNLVIVESPAKAKTISKILGTDFTVMPSVGHIRDLPEKQLGIDASKGFEMTYEISPGKTKVVSELRKAARASDKIYLAPDPDREGEAIAWHLHEVLAPSAKGKEFLRVQYNEITPRAVTYAIAHPGEIDMDRVNAQQARRAIDRFVGFDVSTRLQRRVRGAKSAGRVQTVALRLVCEREEKIRAFKPEPYWVVGAKVAKIDGASDPFLVRLAKINGEKAEIVTEERASKVMADLEPRQMRVSAIRQRDISKNALPPFITSTLQQAASSVLGYSPSRTMALAQRLYEGVDIGGSTTGLITYMRTDAPAVSQDARDASREFIERSYGREFLPEKPNVYRSRQSAQEAHEAIRPTDVNRTPNSLSGVLDPQELKLYDLIWRRFIASQMAPAGLSQRTVEVEAVPVEGTSRDTYMFTATSTEVVFEGFLKVMKLDIRKSLRTPEGRENLDEAEDDDQAEEESLPALTDGEALRRLEWISDRKETKPPSRYSEASLIRAMEENGVGRPSTYASIIETLHDRKYVVNSRKPLQPTQLGEDACRFLTNRYPTLFDVAFTARMEEDLDEVEDGKEDWRGLLGDFHQKFTGWLKEAPADVDKLQVVLDECAKVAKWGEPVKRGRRIIDDGKFVNSIRAQYEEGKKAISAPQLESLVKIVLRYEDQIPGVKERLSAAGLGELVEAGAVKPPPPGMVEKFALLLSHELPERQRAIAESIKSQMESHRALSPKQIALVDTLLERIAPQIENAQEVLAKLGVKVSDGSTEPDTESPELIRRLSRIKTWLPPSKRGRMVYDDEKFAKSLSEQFARSNFLTPRQRAALNKMLARYKSQTGE